MSKICAQCKTRNALLSEKTLDALMEGWRDQTLIDLLVEAATIHMKRLASGYVKRMGREHPGLAALSLDYYVAQDSGHKL